MPEPKIVLTLDARRDLASLFDWIVIDAGTERAETILRRVEQTIKMLAAWPRIGRIRPSLNGDPRTFAVGPWIIFYDLLPTGEGIHVLRVVDGRRDLDELDG